MIKSEANIYNSNIEMPPAVATPTPAAATAAENLNAVLNLSLKKSDSETEAEKGVQIIRFAKRRKLKRTKSAGIF